MIQNRRDLVRLGFTATVDVLTPSTFWTGFTENISEGGLFLATAEPLRIGDEVAITLGIEGDPPIELTGVVRWLRLSQGPNGPAPGAGVQFVGMNEETSLRIHRFMETRREALFYDMD